MALIDNRFVMLGEGGGNGRLPSEYQEVEWIQNSRYSYIATQYYHNYLSKYQFKVQKINMGANYAIIFGARSAYNLKDAITVSFHGTSSLSFNIGGKTNDNFGTLQHPNDPCEWYVDYSSIIINENQYTTNATPPTDCIYDDWMFMGNQKNTYLSDYGIMRMYNFKISEDSLLMRNYIPCYRKSDEEIGMYDLCGSICPLTGTSFYVNAGTGTFTKGNDV